MEGNGRRLAWVAIALSVIALIVSVSGRAQSHWQVYNESRGMYAAPAGPQSQFGQQGPQGQFGQPDQQGPQNQFGRRGQFGPQGPQGKFGPQGFGRPPFFLLPFMLIGGLFKLLFVGLLIWLGLRLITGRGFGGPWGRGRWGHGPWEHGDQRGPSEPDRPQGPGPEQPPYTDDTKQV
jgi:hypothetical protein